jgi:pteridine reductase
MSNHADFSPRVFVTGGAVRIGAAIVRCFAAAGYRVVIHYWQSADAAKSLLSELGGGAAGHTMIKADLRDQEQLSQLLPTVSAGDDPPTVLINNASVYSRRTLLQTEPKHLADAYAINFLAPFTLMRSFATNCRQGVIINMLDQRVAQADFRAGPYGLAKKSLRDLTEAAALEWAPQIRVNGIAPGLVSPPPGVKMAKMTPLVEKVPIKQPTDAMEVAKTCLFLAEAKSITGQILFLDGGLHLLGPNAVGEIEPRNPMSS